MVQISKFKVISVAALSSLLLWGGAFAFGMPQEPKSGVKVPADLGGCKQSCFKQYQENVARCQELFSRKLIIIHLGYDEPDYGRCKDMAKDVYDACVRACEKSSRP